MATPQSPGAKSSAQEPVLLEAINLTMRTVEERTRRYRNLVIAVSITVFATSTAVVVLRRWFMWAGFAVLPLYVLVFLHFDARTVTFWHDRVLQMRDEQGLDLAQLHQTLSGFRHLPQATLRSMLATLTRANPAK